MKGQVGVSAAFVALILVAVIIVAAVGFFLVVQQPGALDSTTTTMGSEPVVTSAYSNYFPNGYNSQLVNFSSTHSGDVIMVGNVSFLYVTPSNLETRTMTVGPTTNPTTTVAVVTADYQCGVSMGQQRVFFAQLPAGHKGEAVKLDYCLVLNTAIAQGAYAGGVAHPWDLWEVSTGLGTTVAVHMTGSGEQVSLVELCVQK